MTPPLPPPNGMLTTAHFQVIQEASARTSSSVTSGAKRMPPLAGPRAIGVLHAIAGEDLDAAVVELHGDVDGDFLGGGAEHLAHAVVELEPLRGLVEARGGGEPGILFVLERMETGDVNVATISLRSHYAIVRELNPCWLKALFA